MKSAVTLNRPVGAMLALACGLAALADNKDQFKVIIERNPFGLKEVLPPPPPPPPPEPPKTVKLSGIVSIIGPPRAMLVRQEPGQTKPDYLTLREGEKDGAVEVVRIDAEAGEVEIINGGVKKVLNFKDDGLGPKPGGPGPAVAAGPGGAQPLGVQLNYTGTAQAVPTWAARPANTMGAGVAPQPGAAFNLVAPTGGAAGPNFQPDLRPTPTRTMRVTIQPQGNAVPPPPPKIDPQMQELYIELNRVASKQQVERGELPPLPPTSLTPPTP